MTQLVRGYVNASGIGKRGSCHLFRHTMATLMLEGGCDIRYIQAMLGHVKLDTTTIYTQVSIRRLKEMHTATHPGARLGRKERDEGNETGEVDGEKDHEDGGEEAGDSDGDGHGPGPSAPDPARPPG